MPLEGFEANKKLSIIPLMVFPMATSYNGFLVGSELPPSNHPNLGKIDYTLDLNLMATPKWSAGSL